MRSASCASWLICRKVFKGTHIDDDAGARVPCLPHVEITASRPFPVYADGEHLTDLPVSVRVLPRALSVLAPVAIAEA